MWNEPDRATRLALIERAWTTEGRYVDPLQEAQGHDALSAMVDAIQEQFPVSGSGARAVSTATTTRCASPGIWLLPTAR